MHLQRDVSRTVIFKKYIDSRILSAVSEEQSNKEPRKGMFSMSDDMDDMSEANDQARKLREGRGNFSALCFEEAEGKLACLLIYSGGPEGKEVHVRARLTPTSPELLADIRTRMTGLGAGEALTLNLGGLCPVAKETLLNAEEFRVKLASGNYGDIVVVGDVSAVVID
jgi:hypothetical protein